MVFSISLGKRFGKKGLLSVSIHPRVINTNLLKGDADESVKALSESLLMSDGGISSNFQKEQ